MENDIQVFGHARRFASLGIANAIVDALKGAQPSSSSVVCACVALKAVAVNVCFSFLKLWKTGELSK